MNAGVELIEAINNAGLIEEDILFIHIRLGDEYSECTEIISSINGLNKDAINRLLCINYDDGYGGQELFGYVVFKNNSWLERYEYDGAESWHFKQCPTWQEAIERLKI